MSFQLALVIDTFQKRLALKSSQLLVQVVFDIVNRNWRDFILKNHCFHDRNIWATVISGTEACD